MAQARMPRVQRIHQFIPLQRTTEFLQQLALVGSYSNQVKSIERIDLSETAGKSIWNTPFSVKESEPPCQTGYAPCRVGQTRYLELRACWALFNTAMQCANPPRRNPRSDSIKCWNHNTRSSRTENKLFSMRPWLRLLGRAQLNWRSSGPQGNHKSPQRGLKYLRYEFLQVR
jgi:hypothetical protein